VSNETPLKYVTVYYHVELVVGIVDAQRIVSKGSALMLDLTILSRGWRPKFQPKARRSRRLHAMNERGLGF
jgi:hypothetical protein